MEPQHEEVHDTDGTRAGSTPHIVRWVLIISLLLAIVLLSITWITGALSMGERDSQATTTDRTADQAGTAADGTDSIVSDGADQLQDTAPSAASSSDPTAVEN
ncbi:MAG TPA: hypothetical protein VL100_04090 [Croceibacterium sp.]|nr:hypothetical protein [Croceibacterium sp.]